VEFYRRCRSELADGARIFWDRRLPAIAAGIGSSGRFERYFALFRKRLLPWIHGQGRIDELLQPRGLVDRRRFFDERWSTLAWRALFKVFFSRLVMGRCGRDPAFFDYVEGSVADRILARSRHALRELDPSVNPYLHWILKGCHGEALPLALRAEHFDTIRNRLDRLNWRQTSIEGALAQGGVDHFDRYNLSDIFEYMSPLAARTLLERLHEAGRDGGRLVYWNMLVPRQRPAALADRLESLDGRGLLAEDKAWFYSALRIERVHKAP
jgi:S-adenosylmethionine-diacylglycerol 3-amino-3-carboxypropyl transferase